MAARQELKYYCSYMEPLIKWYGGLEGKTELVKSMMPRNFENYYEPFVGGGAMFFSMDGRTCFVNDKCRDLMHIYRLVKKEDKQFLSQFKMMCKAWKDMEVAYLPILEELQEVAIRNANGAYHEFIKLVEDVNALVDQIRYGDIFHYAIPDPVDFKMEKRHQVIQEIVRMERQVELDDEDIEFNLKLALKQSVFAFLTEVLNRKSADSEIRSAALTFILNTSADVPYRKDQFREIRLPFGGKKVFDMNLREKVRILTSAKLKRHMERTTLCNMNALEFLKKYEPTADDFVLLDPPDEVKKSVGTWCYSTEEYKTLADYLIRGCDAKWMLIVKPNNSTIPEYKAAHLRVQRIEELDKVIVKNY